MFVLIALESIYFSQKRQMPTQLAAARVDEKWQPMEVFATLFHPMGGMRVDFNNPAFSGASASDYLSALPAYMVLNAFAAWLKQDDVLCFWQADTRSLLQFFMRIILKKPITQRMITLSPYLQHLVHDELRVQGSPYQVARARKFDIPLRFDEATNDVEVIRIKNKNRSERKK